MSDDALEWKLIHDRLTRMEAKIQSLSDTVNASRTLLEEIKSMLANRPEVGFGRAFPEPRPMPAYQAPPRETDRDGDARESVPVSTFQLSEGLIISLWQGLKEEGRFTLGGLRSLLEKKQIAQHLQATELEGISSSSMLCLHSGDRAYVIPSFLASPDSVMAYFDQRAESGSRFARVNELIKPASGRFQGRNFELKEKGLIS